MPQTPPSFDETHSLREADAQDRLKNEGYNELPRSNRRTPLRIVLEVVREPMLALLLGGGVVYLLLSDVTEALILLLLATLSVLITVVQETRTERVLEALHDLSSPRALVIRDGQRKRIAGRDVVRGDFVVLAEGDRVPADAVLVQGHDLQTDESLLTGESVPVRKIASEDRAASKALRPGGDDLPFVFSGSLVVRGTGVAEVIATGARSEIGKIGQTLSALEVEPPRLRAQTRRLVLGRYCWRRGKCPGSGALWDLARWMAGCAARRYRARDVDAARGAPSCAHGVHGDGRVANLACARADPARIGHRNAWLRDGSMHRQDGHTDPEPHVDRGALGGERRYVPPPSVE